MHNAYNAYFSLDMVILAGDLTDITADNGKFMTYPLKDLNAPLGKYFVTGKLHVHNMHYVVYLFFGFFAIT